MHPALTLAAFATVALPGEGWVGNWRPGIGDPGLLGWATVLAYFVAAFVCYGLRRRFSPNADRVRRGERRFWTVLAAVLLFLCINKQLDLQTAMTELFRMVFRQGGWYENRRIFQLAFILAMAAGFPVAAYAVFRATRRLPSSSRLAGLGLVLIAVFVLVRAASFHHVDRLLAARLLHFKLNWLLELGGVAVVLVGALRRRRELCRDPHAR